MKDIILAYDLDTLPMVELYVREAREAPTILACTFSVEQELAKKGIACESFSHFRLSDNDLHEAHTIAQTISREWYRTSQFDFFTYKNICLAEAAEPAIEGYFHVLLYFFLPLLRIIDAYAPIGTIIVPNKNDVVSSASGAFTVFELNALVELVEFLAAQKGFKVKELGERAYRSADTPHLSFIEAMLMRLWNSAIRVFVRPKKLKLYASEYWSHIAPLMEVLEDTELVMMERSAIRQIPWSTLFAHRMRFVHPLMVRPTPESAVVLKKYMEAWQLQRPQVFNSPLLRVYGFDMGPLVISVFDHLFEHYAAQLVHQIDAFDKIFRREETQKVILRASVSGHQPHFFLAAKVAIGMGIPSIELQHAGAVLDPNSVHSRMEASYLAAYGILTRDIYCKNHGYAPERIRAIGSPRFDRYMQTVAPTEEERDRQNARLGFDITKPVVTVAVPADLVGLMAHNFSSYDNRDMFESLKRLQEKIPEIQYIFKFRPGNVTPHHREYLATLFAGKTYAAVDDDLFKRIRMSDVILSHNSTTMYETMICRKPLLLYPWRYNDPAAPVYGQAAPLILNEEELYMQVQRAVSDDVYRRQLVEKQSGFLATHYVFDGHSSERLVALLHEVLNPQQGSIRADFRKKED